MTILPATINDLPTVLAIYERARQYMRDTGNPNQWRNTNPTVEQTKKDIENGCLYVVKDNDGIQGVFALIGGEDPTYTHIDGTWLNNKPYVTIHRIASAGHKHGVLQTCVEYAETVCDNVRIDTHADNRVMQHLLGKLEFVHCGTIYLENGEPRLAYQKTLM